MEHLFLTGSKQIGKSTLIRHALSGTGVAYTGFETRPLIIGGVRRGFSMHGFAELPVFENDVLISARIGQRLSVGIPEAFEGPCVRMLEAALASPVSLLLMDEIGKLESRSPAFAAAVLRALDRKNTIGVLQQTDSELLASVRARKDVRVLTVTEKNRDALLLTVTEWLERVFKL